MRDIDGGTGDANPHPTAPEDYSRPFDSLPNQSHLPKSPKMKPAEEKNPSTTPPLSFLKLPSWSIPSTLVPLFFAFALFYIAGSRRMSHLPAPLPTTRRLHIATTCTELMPCHECNDYFNLVGRPCKVGAEKRENFRCEESTDRVLREARSYLYCDEDGDPHSLVNATDWWGGNFNTSSPQMAIWKLARCEDYTRFDMHKQRCIELFPGNQHAAQRTPFIISTDGERAAKWDSDTEKSINSLDSDMGVGRKKRSRASRGGGGSRTGEMCAFNTDCQSGMYCLNGMCTCLSNYVSVAGSCWPKVNPGDSGCVEDLQCEGVWPGAKCARGGICQCAEHYVPAKTRDGTVCVAEGAPPSCPLPEPNNPEAPSPATILANPSTHPLAADEYMPVLCTSTSTEVENSNGGDGSSWCIYPNGALDIYVADIYNCVAHPQVRSEHFPEYADTVDGICCPSRAFVCVQPQTQGDEPSVPRWWYNSITGTCTQFLWDPSQSENVSPNNFRTMEHCESYCRDTCRRGPNQFNPRHSRDTIADETPVTNCLHASVGGCGPEYHCALVGSNQHCCPTVGNICSPMGGRLPPYVAREAFDAGEAIAGSLSVSRFYYNADLGRCMSFLYDGLGNYNNFLTKADCEGFCSKLVCEYGNPLRIGEDWQRCESHADCPSSHQCESAHKVCCPTAQSLCTQPKRLGDCTSSVERFYYNPTTRQCEMFQYTGCQGNDNNFETLLDCQLKCKNIALEPKCPQGRAYRDGTGNFLTCSLYSNSPSTKGDIGQCPPNYQCHFDGSTHGCCPTKAYTCSLSADKGVQCGAGRSFRYHFNANRQSCDSFQYEGCDGNANNFQSAEECSDYCGVGGCLSGGQPLRDPNTNQLLVCGEGEDRPNSCPATHECVLINEGGGSGNSVSRCCPTKEHICSLPPQHGSACAKQPITRWYFNIVTKECGRFSFNGCNGNLNNFDSLEQCVGFCSAAACAPGELTYKDANTRRLLHCSPTLAESCPTDYRCRYEPLSGKSVCCGTPHIADVCPLGEKAYLSPSVGNEANGEVKECAINIPGSCPTNFLCRFSPAHNRYYCCSPRSGSGGRDLCPDGKALFRNSHSHQPTRCTVGSSALGPASNRIQIPQSALQKSSTSMSSSSCPENYSCQSRLESMSQGYCCSSQPCDEGYHCHRARNDSVGYCCKGEQRPATAGCPPGEYALITRSRDEDIVQQCDPFNTPDKGCPPMYTCQYAVAFQRYQCCSKVPPGTDEDGEEEGRKVEEASNQSGCPSGQVAYLQGGAQLPQLCTSSAPNTCPLGFFCQFSEANSQFQCCAHKAGCPADTVAYVDMEGRPQACRVDAPTRSQCPIGYSCRSTGAGKDICCTVEGADRFTTRNPGSAAWPTTHPPPFPASLVELPGGAKSGGSMEIRLPAGGTVTNRSLTATTFTGSPAKGEKGEEIPPTTPSKMKIGTRPANGKRCKANELFVNGLCVERQIGDGCITVRQCPATSQCVEYRCQCPEGTVPIANENRCASEATSTAKTVKIGIDKDKDGGENEVTEEEEDSDEEVNTVDYNDSGSDSQEENGEDEEEEEKKLGSTSGGIITSTPATSAVGKIHIPHPHINNVVGSSSQQKVIKRPMVPHGGFTSIPSTSHASLPSGGIVAGPRVPKKCAPDEILYGSKCLRRRLALGATCAINLQCATGLMCIAAKCRCPGGKAGHNNKCYAHVCGSDKFRLPQLDAATNVVICGQRASGPNKATAMLFNSLIAIRNLSGTNSTAMAKPSLHQSQSNRNCEYPHRCTFSKLLHEYICCRLASADIARLVTAAAKTTALVKAPSDGANESDSGGIQQGPGSINGAEHNRTLSTTLNGPAGNSGNQPNEKTAVDWPSPFPGLKKGAENLSIGGNGPVIHGKLPDHSNQLDRTKKNGRKKKGKRKSKRHRRRCLDGSRPLLFHGTRYPVKCESLVSCPHGYSCIRNMCCHRRMRPTSTALTIAEAKRKTIAKQARERANRERGSGLSAESHKIKQPEAPAIISRLTNPTKKAQHSSSLAPQPRLKWAHYQHLQLLLQKRRYHQQQHSPEKEINVQRQSERPDHVSTWTVVVMPDAKVETSFSPTMAQSPSHQRWNDPKSSLSHSNLHPSTK